MKKILAIPVFLFLLLVATQSPVLSSGYSMAVLMEDTSTVVLVKFDSSSFNQDEAMQYSQMVGNLIGSNPGSHVFYHNQLGDPDELRSVLSNYTEYYQVIFLDMATGASRVPASGPNMWVDAYYDNMGMYVASLGFPVALMDMFY